MSSLFPQMKLSLPLLFLFASAAAAAETIRCPATKDVWLSCANAKESDSNGGKSPKLKLKALQEFALIDFDVAALRGKQIEKATLYVAPVGGARFAPPQRGSDLRWFSVSTVSSPWEEGEGVQYAADAAGKGATFNEASYRTRPWTIPGSRCWDVILGNGKSVRHDVDAGEPQDGWFAIPLNPRLVQAMVANASYGLCLMDGSTGIDRNSYISSREGKNPPYLEVTARAFQEDPPRAPEDLLAEPAPNEASAREGAMRLSFRPPPRAFAYAARIDGRSVLRWQLPFADLRSERQELLFEHLPPGQAFKVEIAAIDDAGKVSPYSAVTGKSSAALSVSKLPELSPPPAAQPADPPNPKLKVWAFPEGSKLNPLTGRLALESGLEDAAAKNAVWDGQSSSIRLATARGGIASVQLAFEMADQPLEDLEVTLDLPGGFQASFWRAWFVNVKGVWQQEYALPGDLKAGSARSARAAGLSIPAGDNAIPGQRAGVVVLDLVAPPNAKAAVHRGVVTASARGVAPVKIPLSLRVFGAQIPAEIHFNPELNCYGGPTAGTEPFFEMHRLAHYHRCSVNRVTHSHNGRWKEDAAPRLDPGGRVTDWSAYDRAWGPLLDGSAFKDNPRASVPVACLYLPHHENWPLPMKEWYDVGVSTEGPNWKALHDLRAWPPEEAFNPHYRQTMVSSVAEFVEHFETRGWNKTVMQFFQNNKHQYGKEGMTGTAWMMDEPNEYLDWHALAFYSRLLHEGLRGARTVRFQYRGDVSRPMWQGTLMDGLMELLYANSQQFAMGPLMRDFKRRSPMKLICYGACNPPERSNHETTAWCLKSYVSECDGVVPWQSLGGDDAFDRGDPPGGGNALIVDGSKRFGVSAIASFRVFALRQGAQLCELLRLLEAKRGWSRRHSALLVSQLIPMETNFRQAFADDAAPLQFGGGLDGDQLATLKEGLLKLLTE